MNEKKPTWVCPVCDKKAPYEHLIIDGLFMEILNSCSDCDEIQFKEDGNWAPMRSKREVQEVSASYNGVDSDSSRTDAHEQKRGSSNDNGKKVDVIDLTLDSSSEDELDDEPPPKRACPSLSPVSPPPNKGVLNLHSQASPVTRAPSMPPVETSYIPPPPPLIQDYRHYYHTTSDLPDLSFFSFLQGDNQHYNMVMAAAAAASASASEDHDLLLNRFLPYGSSQMLREQPGTPGSSTLAATNGGSNSGSTSSLVSSSSLRDRDKDRERDRDRDSHSISGLSRSSVEAAAAAAIYGSISDVISLD
ncbi:E3 SUMO-protein ligase PIAS1 [Collichthys lucidus]|uniref:E3 SUMO-protein ligase PIAS1 n=1 Tax=Collichthys lucidus TaxID=240159 RepID=A0A4U5UJ17_COLLU|nr:E3 SUMO-protein ligase PIAS1 [Collichthys lucidus]